MIVDREECPNCGSIYSIHYKDEENREECPNCGSIYSTHYKDEETGEAPTFCPFCGECLEDWDPDTENELWEEEYDE